MTDTQVPASGPAADLTDSQLAERARDGDREAFAALYERHASYVFNFVYDLVRNQADAEDVVQTTFLRALEGIGTLRDTDSVLSWLLTIAYNAVRGQGRKRRPESLDALVENTTFDVPSEAAGPEQAAVSRDLANLVWTAARSLDDRQFAVLNLSLRYALSPAEIAQVVGVEPNALYSLLYRAQQKLGDAVRVATVVQVQDVCPDLRALVPTGRRGPLTAFERQRVERHMRSCDACRSAADRMTAPTELFSGILLLPLPAGLAARNWLHAARNAQPVAPSRGWPGRSGGATRRIRLPLAALGVAGVVAVGGVAGGVAAITHARPATEQRHIPPRPSAAATPHPAATATPLPASPTVAAATAPDESGKTADQVWADMLTATRAAQGYHIAFTTKSLSDQVTQFDVQFSRSGDYTGTVTLASASHDPFTVRKVNGVMYAQGPAIVNRPDVFGLTQAQAAQVGSGWLTLSGSRQDLGTLIDQTLSMWGDPEQLADSVFTVQGTLRLDGIAHLNREELIVLGDDSGTVSVTRFGAFPRRASNDIDSATFSDFNVPVTVAAPAGALAFP